MGKIKERGKAYALHKASDKLNDYYGSAMLNVVQFDGYNIQSAYVDGYLQAEQDLKVKDIDEIIKNAEDHAYFAGSENTREKLIDKACKWLREGGTGWYLTSESGGDEINFVKLAEDFRKAMEDE